MIGTRLGHYQITAHLGSGGFGDVYQATDSKLERSVAIKLLPEAFARDIDRASRFEREARVLASLNHTNIASIHGFEDSDGRKFLVMELVPGETLQARLKRGAIPVADALTIAKQIAEALEAAHDKGVIHRDLKPGNLMLTGDGKVKVLDFGLAKAYEANASDIDISNSPTMVSMMGTNAGVILGTAAYMSPEQAAGKPLDKRSDLWAFGAVLMEMLTGQQVFIGETVSHVLAAVLAKDPDWTTLPLATPSSIRKLLRRCLEKDRKRRIADAADVGLEIDDALTTSPDDANVSNRTRPANLWSHVAVGVGVAVVTLGIAFAWRAADRGQPSKVYASIDAPANFVLGEDDDYASLPTRTPMVFTADGRSLVIQAATTGKPQLFLRSLDRPDARPIAGTEGARVPFVSPDGKWVAFWAANKLQKVPLEGGAATAICPLTASLGPYGAAWGANDTIVFGDPASGRIMRVPANGGTPSEVTAQPSRVSRRRHVAPSFLPDGTRFLFSDVSEQDANASRLMVQSLSGGDARLVVDSATDGRLMPSGLLAFMRLGTLMTVAFDLASAETTGEPVAAMGGVMQSAMRGRGGATNTGAGMFAVSGLGTLAVIRGGLSGASESTLIWTTSDGRSSSAEASSGAPAGARLFTRIAPDRSRATVTIQTPLHREIWFVDWARDIWTSCGDCNSESDSAVWSPDGRRLLLQRHDTFVARAVDGSGSDQVVLHEPDRYVRPTAWLTDGGIVYMSSSDLQKYEVKFLEAGGNTGRVIVPEGSDPNVSPDRRWLAYELQGNVMVQAFPGPGSRTQVSAGGGFNPAWSADGRKLYYLKNDESGSTVFAVDVAPAAGALSIGTPRELFRHTDGQGCNPTRCYDLAADGRFLFRERSTKRQSVTRMDLVLNWTSTLPKGK